MRRDVASEYHPRFHFSLKSKTTTNEGPSVIGEGNRCKGFMISRLVPPLKASMSNHLNEVLDDFRWLSCLWNTLALGSVNPGDENELDPREYRKFN